MEKTIEKKKIKTRNSLKIKEQRKVRRAGKRRLGRFSRSMKRGPSSRYRALVSLCRARFPLQGHRFLKNTLHGKWGQGPGSVDPSFPAGLPFPVPEALEFVAFRDSGKTIQQFSRDFPGVFLGNPRTDPGNSHSFLEFSDLSALRPSYGAPFPLFNCWGGARGLRAQVHGVPLRLCRSSQPQKHVRSL